MPRTCSAVIADFFPAFADHDKFQALPVPAWAAEFSSGGHVATLPERDGGDGFFAAILQRA